MKELLTFKIPHCSFYFHFTDYCCSKIELKYKKKNKATILSEILFGNYSVKGLINGRTYYTSDFDEGAYGIWWCSKWKRWYVYLSSKKGQCIGLSRSKEVDQCVHDIENWQYYDTGKFFKAGEGISLSCLNSGNNHSLLAINIIN